MLSELCQEIRNWFDRNQPKIREEFEIQDGRITNESFTDIIQDGQYFRIIGSVFNDGVHKYDNSLSLIDESFDGTIWLMAVPPAVISLSNEIDSWIAKYGEGVNSPYSSESFGGYSYTKATRTGSGSGTTNPTWQSVFASKLNLWRKV